MTLPLPSIGSAALVNPVLAVTCAYFGGSWGVRFRLRERAELHCTIVVLTVVNIHCAAAEQSDNDSLKLQ